MALYSFVDQVGPAVPAVYLNELDQIRNVTTVPVNLASMTIAVPTSITAALAVSGIATFASSVAADGALTLNLAGDGALIAPLIISSSRPQINFVETDASANNRRWAISAQGEQLIYSAVTDGGVGTSYMTVDRTAGAVDGVSFAAPIIGTSSGGGAGVALQLASANPVMFFRETDASANNQIWDITATGETLLMRVVNDAYGVATAWATIDRTTTTVDAVNFSATTITHTGGSSFQSGATATVATLNSTNAGGPAAVFQRSGTSFGDIGNASIIFGGTADAMCVNARSTNHIEFATNGTLRQRIGGTGTIFFPSIGTTASAANAFLDSGSSPVNQLLRSTSSVRYKTDVKDVTDDEVSRLFDLRPITYRSLCEGDDKQNRWYGLIAEEVADVLPQLVQYSFLSEEVEFEVEVDGKLEKRKERRRKSDELVPESVQYERLVVLLLAKLKDQQEQIDSLREEFAELKKKPG